MPVLYLVSHVVSAVTPHVAGMLCLPPSPHLQLCRTRLSCLPISVFLSVISLLFASATPSTSLFKAHGPADNVTALQANTESYLLIFSPIWFEDSIVAETFYTNVS